MGYLDTEGLSHLWGKIKDYTEKHASGGTSEEVYSTEETRIGTWIDGKPLYRKVITARSPTAVGSWSSIAPPIENADVKIVHCSIETSANIISCLPDMSSGNMAKWSYNGNSKTTAGLPSGFCIYPGVSAYAGKQATVVIEYTKTTD